MLLFIPILVMAGASKADLVSPSPIWKRDITHVYVCSAVEEITSDTLESFYAQIPQTNMSAEFHNGWSDSNDEYKTSGEVVIVSIAPQEYDSSVSDCLNGIPYFQESWLEDILTQANEIGTVPEYLANTPLGKHYEPLKASWIYRYGDGAILSSYIYQSSEHFSHEDALSGALQFKNSSTINSINSGDN